jgi:membrane fusion protein (multidrug efflux system)
MKDTVQTEPDPIRERQTPPELERLERESVSESEAVPRSRKLGYLIGAGLIVLVSAYFLWNYYSVRETTDDAEVEGHIHPISFRVGGTVTAVHIHENMMVKSGDVLVELDPKDYQVARDRARADLADAEAALEASRTDLPITATTVSSALTGAEARVEEARANLSSSEKEVEAASARLRAAQARVEEAQANAQKAARDLERMKQLIAKEEISQQQYDASVAASESLRAAVESAQAEVSGAEQTLQAARNNVERERARVTQSQAAAAGAKTGPQQIAVIQSRVNSAAARVEMAKSALEQAELNLQYTVLRAAVDGEISKKSVEMGQTVQPGQPVFAIVTAEDTWVQASFKETQLKNIRIGQPAIVSVDALGGRKFKGHVDSIAAATGAKFSLLPPENATGNYVKVVQRLPVKILLEPGEDPQHLLRPGMSVVPTVITK